MAKTPYSGEMVRNNKKVILTIPGAEMAEAVMGCRRRNLTEMCLDRRMWRTVSTRA
ncbi:hypothetical protein [Bacteroides acidifaciens]|uniref:hypothetical protein n=1 Tax=Bacteroides acidifaciens TaxID=85831 RepID=UPI0025B497E5|nr:hypothetical protein [Bacteroides acidifaciens]